MIFRNTAKLKAILRFCARHLFSHIGLFCVLCFYCVGGAYLFALIETPGVIARIRDTVNVSRRLEQQRQYLMDVLVQRKCDVDFNETVRNLLDDYQKSVADAIQNHSYVGTPQREEDIQNGWVFPSALLFAITIVTTIGYGQVTPKTALGQLMVIPYALLGIPIMLMFLAIIGDFLARGFRLAYTRACCCACWRWRNKNHHADKENRKWRENEGRRTLEHIDTIESQNDGKTATTSAGGSTEDRPASQSSGSQETELPDDELLNVPISLTVVVAVAYLFIGAVLFASWNGWTWVQGAYFTFATLTTIGFGDFIPGWQEVGTTTGNVKLVISCVYIIVGLAVLSMAFNLVVDEMIAKLKWLARQAGIIQREDDHADEIHPRPSHNAVAVVEKVANYKRINHAALSEKKLQTIEEVEDIT